MGKLAILLAMAMLVMAMAMASVILPSSYLLMEPGPAIDVSTMISVPDDYQGENGNLYLTSVSVRSVTLAQWAAAQLDPAVRILPRDEIQPDEITAETYRRIQVELLEESKTVAKIVALRELGYDVEISGQGVLIEAVLPSSPARDRLQTGDIIVGLNGAELSTATALVESIRKAKPGDSLNLLVVRGDQRLDIQSPTIESTTTPGQAMLGILVTTRMFDYKLPFDVNIGTDNLGGPSAGLMFTLGIIDALMPDDLTRGHRIAGTGTISVDGTVGGIDGVKQKVIGAERAGAEYFLAPVDNYEDAKAAASRLTVISVATVSDALSFLGSIEDRTTAIVPGKSSPSIVWVPAL